MNALSSLTPDQATALLPLLQTIASSQSQQTYREDSSVESSADSSFTVPEEHFGHGQADEANEVYTLRELITKKCKNAKSTKAQNFLHVNSVNFICLTT